MKENLNEKQKEAVETLEGPLLILAGAGAGKTKTIAERIRHLVREGVTPGNILAITFTNKAAKEMRERVERMLAEDPVLNRPVSSTERPFVSTFHSLGVHILKENAAKLGLKRHFAIFDKDDGKRAVREALKEIGLDPKTHEPDKILSIISKEKGRDTTYSEYAERAPTGYFSEVVRVVWEKYEKALRENSALDFDDLLLKTVRLLRSDAEVRAHYRNTWQYIHIDEYQDTNKVQYEIAKLLTNEKNNICVVGDIDQSIYSWRGADIGNILSFERDFPNAVVILLEENYRSTQNILNAANAVIEKNKFRRKKTLWSKNQEGERVRLFMGYDEVSEASFVAEEAQKLIQSGLKPEEIAILFRANFQSRVLEEAFLQKSLPYQLLGTRFFERKEVRDVLSYLRAALNPESLSDVKRIINVPTRGLGKASVVKVFAKDEASLPASARQKVKSFWELLEKIREVAEKSRPSETVGYIIRETGLETLWREGKEEGEDRLENAYELGAFAARFDHLTPQEGIEKLLEEAALQSDQDELEKDRGGVRLMTVHASKGLEFDAVFIVGLEDGLFPHEKSSKDLTPEESEEERRLFYVALTRARKKVTLSYAQVRMIYGQRQVNIPSEFIYDIPPELVEEIEADPFQGGGRERSIYLD